MEPMECEEVDPNKLISKNGVLGFERPTGFEEVTNFDLKAEAYVGDGEGSVIGYIVRIILAIRDPLSLGDNSSRRLFLTNRQLGNNATIINCMTAKFDALWIAQSKDTFLPQFVYNLCKEYMKTPTESIKSFKPVKIVGKQPNDDVWVFNPDVHVDAKGSIIPEEDREYVSMESSQLPFLDNIPPDLDDGESLKKLLEAEQVPFQNNYPQVVLAHAASSMACNYEIILKMFDGCPLPVLRGTPVSGKTTALKAVMSVFGIREFTSESSSRYKENKQAQTTVTFGWDDAPEIKVLKNISVNSYNGVTDTGVCIYFASTSHSCGQGLYETREGCGSSTMKKKLCPRTVPVVTTNLDTCESRVNSRWLRLEFDALTHDDKHLNGKDKIIAEMNLKKAMADAPKSVNIMTTFIHNALKTCKEDDIFCEILAEVEKEPLLKRNVRIGRNIGVLLYCTKKILEKVELQEQYMDVWDKVKLVIIPSYNKERPSLATVSREKCTNIGVLRNLFREHFIPVIVEEELDDLNQFLGRAYNPSKCPCGLSVVFHVKSVLALLKIKIPSSVLPLASVTESSIRNFIKTNNIGCVGAQVKFKKRAKQCNAAHVQRSFFKEEDLKLLDEKFGLGEENNNRRQPAENVPNQNEIRAMGSLVQLAKPVEHSPNISNDSADRERRPNCQIPMDFVRPLDHNERHDEENDVNEDETVNAKDANVSDKEGGEKDDEKDISANSSEWKNKQEAKKKRK